MAHLPLQEKAFSQSAVTVTAQAGLRGFCKASQWLPVHVRVENKGADVNARIQAAYKNSAGGQTVSAMDISLPASSRKEFFLYLTPETFMRDFKVSALDGNKTLAKVNLNVNCSEDENILLGVVADTPSNFSTLNNIRPISGYAQTVQLDLDDLPDQPQGWNMLDALIFSNTDTGTLTQQQRQALELWLAGGGKLFVTGGLQWQSTAAGLNGLLPLQPNGVKKTPALDSLSAYALDEENPLEAETILAAGELQAGANVLVEQDGIPVLAEKEIGFGKIYYFAADPGLTPLDNWEGMEDIYNHLLGFKSPKPTWGYGVQETYNANNALSTLPELSLPSMAYICGWLALYILVVGPANYFILRRLKRTELAWVTIPIIVVVFTSLAYAGGYAYRGEKPILNRLMVMQGWQGVEKARVEALVGVYSPRRNAYQVEAREGFLVSPFPSISDALQSGDNWTTLKNESGAVLSEARVEIGGMKSLAAEGYLTAPSIEHDLTMTLSDKTPLLEGSVKNTSKHTWKDAVLVTPSGWRTLGDIEPGEIKNISYALASLTTNMSGFSLANLTGWAPYATDDISQQRRSFLLHSLSNAYGDINANAGIYLMAWAEDEILAPVVLQGETSKTADTLLYFVKLNPKVKIKTEDLSLTSGVYHWESSLGDALGANSYDLGSEGYNVRFHPSVPVKFSRVNSLRFSITTTSGAAAPSLLNAAIWNFQERGWQPLVLDINGEAEVESPAQCVGMGGEILLNIKGDPNAYFDITSIDFTLKASP